MDTIAQFIGSLLCHQQPDRTLAFGPWPMPVCARCEGLYLGFLIGLLLQIVLKKSAPVLRRGTGVFILSAGLILALVADGLGSKFHYWDSGNPARFVLGFLGGCGISIFILSLFRYTFIDRNGPFAPLVGWRFFVWAPLAFIFPAIIHLIPLPFLLNPFSMATLIGIAAYYLTFNVAMAGALVDWRTKGASVGNALALGGCVAGLLVLEYFANRWAH